MNAKRVHKKHSKSVEKLVVKLEPPKINNDIEQNINVNEKHIIPKKLYTPRLKPIQKFPDQKRKPKYNQFGNEFSGW